MNAREITLRAYRWLNRLSPGETMNADDSAFALEALNDLVDERSADELFLFQDLSVTAAQTGNITLGAGSWASIASGSQIHAMACDGRPLIPMDMRGYIALADNTTVGTPATYTPDGASAIKLYPVPNGQTITILVRRGVTAFADLDTEYTAPAGYKAALGVSLAIRVAPTLLGGVPAPLVAAERRALAAIRSPRPAALHTSGYQLPRQGSRHILTGGY